MTPLIFVVSAPLADGERFAIFRPEDFHPIGSEFGALEDWCRRATAMMRDRAVLTEREVRLQLAEMGLSEEIVAGKIQQARKVIWTWDQTTIQRTTAIGYRNSNRQEVIRKTGLPGTVPEQRLYVMRCAQCGHEYGANGCDIHSRRCHVCQDGPPGLTIADILG
jgi:hypothetical protein